MHVDFHGKRVLLVEDDALVAAEIADTLVAANATVLGPFGHVDLAERAVPHCELAILDVSLHGRTSFGVADRLLRLDIPYVFFSAHDHDRLPVRFAHIAYIQKPASPVVALRQLSRCARTVEHGDIGKLIPGLRKEARLLLSDGPAADRLVELTLLQALQQDRPYEGKELEGWLRTLMKRHVQAGVAQLLN